MLRNEIIRIRIEEILTTGESYSDRLSELWRTFVDFRKWKEELEVAQDENNKKYRYS